MPSTRRERLLLLDMVEAADAVSEFIHGVSEEEFVGNDLLRSAVLHKLQIIGEAAAHVGEETRLAMPQVPWPQVIGFRNYAVHVYFAVDWHIVWVTASDDAPLIRRKLQELIESGAGEEP